MMLVMGPDAAVRVAQALPDDFEIGQMECEDGQWRGVTLSPSGLVYVRGTTQRGIRAVVGRLVLAIEDNKAPEEHGRAVR